MPAQLFVITYDVEDDTKRKKISDALEDAGGTRVQKSVFECRLTRKELSGLKKKIHKIKAKKDSVRYYSLCKSCEQKIAADEGPGQKEENSNVHVA